MSVILPYMQDGQEPLHNTIRNSFERIRGYMKGRPPEWPAPPDMDVYGHMDAVIQYVDMAGSTKLAMQVGLERYAAMIVSFCNETSGIVMKHGGRPIKYIGDAVLSVYTGSSIHAADTALEAAISIMRMIHHAYVPATDTRVDVHIGMTYGQINSIRQWWGADILGAPVNLASKLLTLERPVVMDSAFRDRLHPETQNIELYTKPWPYTSRVYHYTGGFHG